MTRLNDLRLRAGVTEKEWDALRLWDPDPRGAGYRSVGLALGISKSAAEDRVKRALRKLAERDELDAL